MAEVGRQIARALQKTTVEECLDDISRALLQADVPADLVRKFCVSARERIINLDGNTPSLMQQALFNELCALLEQRKLAYPPEKGRQYVVMFIGLQGSGKTTTCTQYAHYHQKRGWKPSLICADTFRLGAFEQLRQNAMKANVPFFGSYLESDPVTIIKQGFEKFEKEGSDLIIVDTRGQPKQEASLLEEIHQVSEMMSPDLIVCVMDGNIGQAAFDQVEEFKRNVPVGAVILTKMDAHAKGIGALSSVAAAAATSPVIFLGTGEHMDDIEQFKVETVVSRLLGIEDASRFLNKVHVAPVDQKLKRQLRFAEGTVTLRRLYNEYQRILRMEPLDQLIPIITGIVPEDCDNKKNGRVKKFMMILESMSDAELDSTDPKMLLKHSRVNRIARRSGHSTNDVHELLEEFRRRAKLARMMLEVRKKGLPYVGEATSPQILKQAKNSGVVQSLIKQMGLRDWEAAGVGGKL